MATFFIMVLGVLAGRFFPVIPKKKNDLIQLFCTLMLIFSMGMSLGQQDGFFHKLGELGGQSFLFFLLPTICSAVIVYFLTGFFLSKTAVTGDDSCQTKENEKNSAFDPMIFMQ